jgi:hypothetical protein
VPEILSFEVDEDAPPSSLIYTFGGMQPVVSVKPGTVVVTTTMDCFAGLIRSKGDLPSQVLDPRTRSASSSSGAVDDPRA